MKSGSVLNVLKAFLAIVVVSAIGYQLLKLLTLYNGLQLRGIG